MDSKSDNMEEGEVYKSLIPPIHILGLCPFFFFTQDCGTLGTALSGAIGEINNEDGDGINPGHLCQVSMG